MATINELRNVPISHVIDGSSAAVPHQATPEFFQALIVNKDKQIANLLELMKGAQEIILDVRRPVA